jgi:predicted metalloprotease with PDZ domain
MKILETLVLAAVVTASHFGFEALGHTQPLSLTTTLAIGDDKKAPRAVPPVAQEKPGYVGLLLTNNIVNSVFEGSPCDNAGMMAGDKIMEINDKTTFGLDVCGLADRLIGPIGTRVELIVEHGDELRRIKVIRAAAVPEEAQKITAEAKQSRIVDN